MGPDLPGLTLENYGRFKENKRSRRTVQQFDIKHQITL